MTKLEEQLRREILEKSARLVERTRILELNRSDASLLERNGEIFFVLDTNAVQAFLQPGRRPELIRLFHHKLWSASSQEKDNYERLASAVGAEGNLLATEFLLAWELPVGRKRLLMSVPHLEEFAVQANRLLEHIDAIERGHSEEALRRTTERVLELAALNAQPLADAMEIVNRDKLFLSPTIDDRPRTSAEEEGIRNSYVLSAICRVLAEDDLLEPIEQVGRMAQGALAGAIGALEAEFVPDAAAAATIATNEELWHGRLRRALNERYESLNRRPPPLRTQALAADARTLAYLSWVARECLKSDQRIVFVTGDRVILDAYRRWFSDPDVEPGSFLLRPLAQFAPQYNLSDANAHFSSAKTLFTRTRVSIEGTTLPIVMELLNHYRDETGRAGYHLSARVRDRFCIEVATGSVDPALVDALVGRPLTYKREPLEDRVAELDQVAQELRAIERIAMGMLPHLIEQRVQKAVTRSKELAAALDQADGDTNEVTAEWFKQRLDRAITSAFAFSLPLAAARIQEWSTPVEGQRKRRTPATLRLVVPLNGKPVSIDMWLAQTADDRFAALTELRKTSPALVFALASWLTFRNEAWGDAIKFADLAAQAAQYEAQSDPANFVDAEGSTIESEAIRRECLYLKALALRMRMASVRPTASFDSDVWYRDLQRAEEALEISGELKEAEVLIGTRYLRARSERAAVRLTYCAWVAVGDLRKLGSYRQDSIELGEIIGGAVEDLRAVAAALPDVRGRVARREHGRVPREEVLDWVSLQAAANQECARLLCDLLLNAALDPDLRISPADGERHEIIRAYLLSAERRDAGESVRAREIAEEIGAIKLTDRELELDRAMLEAIKRRWNPLAKH